MGTAEEYRKKAATAQSLAAECTDPYSKALWLEVAKSWRQMSPATASTQDKQSDATK